MRNRRKNIFVLTPDGIVSMNQYKAVFMFVVLPIIIACAAIAGARLLLM